MISTIGRMPPMAAPMPPGRSALHHLDEVALFDRVSARLNQSFVLPEDLGVLHLACGTENAFYDPQAKRIRMCDELLNKVVSVVTRNGLAFSDAELVAQVHSTWVLVFLHEVGHAFIDIFDLIVLGNEEDAVDDLAALLLVNAGEASMAQIGLGYWSVTDRAGLTPNATDFADEHGVDLQRY